MTMNKNLKKEPLSVWNSNIINKKDQGVSRNQSYPNKTESTNPTNPDGITESMSTFNLKPQPDNDLAPAWSSKTLISKHNKKGKEAERKLPEKKNSQQVSKLPKSNLKGKPSSCVFVASLLATKTDSQLCETVLDRFKNFGDIVSVKVLRDQINRPYAFVQYTNDEDCLLAIAKCNNSILDGRTLRCEAAKVNRTIFISLFQSLNSRQINELVSKYGPTDLSIACDKSGFPLFSREGPSQNWFLKFSYRDDAIKAFACLSDEGVYRVEWAQNIDDPVPKKSNFDKFSIFIGQLNPRANEALVAEHFSHHGDIKEISVVHKPTSSFAFVTYEDEAAAAGAVALDNHTMFLGHNINVQYREISFTPRPTPTPSQPIALAPPPIRVKPKQTKRLLPNPVIGHMNHEMSESLQERSKTYTGIGIPLRDNRHPRATRVIRPQSNLMAEEYSIQNMASNSDEKWPRSHYSPYECLDSRPQSSLDSVYYIVPQ